MDMMVAKEEKYPSKWFGGKPKGSIIEYKVDINVDIDNVANIDIDNNDDNNDNDINDDINDVGSNDSDSVKNDIDDDIDDDQGDEIQKKVVGYIVVTKDNKGKEERKYLYFKHFGNNPEHTYNEAERYLLYRAKKFNRITNMIRYIDKDTIEVITNNNYNRTFILYITFIYLFVLYFSYNIYIFDRIFFISHLNRKKNAKNRVV